MAPVDKKKKKDAEVKGISPNPNIVVYTHVDDAQLIR